MKGTRFRSRKIMQRHVQDCSLCMDRFCVMSRDMFANHLLHPNHVVPQPKLVPALRKVPDFLEAKMFVEARAHVRKVRIVSPRRGSNACVFVQYSLSLEFFFYQIIQLRAKPVMMHVLAQVYGKFCTVLVCFARVKGGGVCVTVNRAAFIHCDKVRKFLQRVLNSQTEFFERRHIVLKCDCRVFDIRRINCKKSRSVIWCCGTKSVC